MQGSGDGILFGYMPYFAFLVNRKNENCGVKPEGLQREKG